jgi:hypothetical protein
MLLVADPDQRGGDAQALPRRTVPSTRADPSSWPISATVLVVL